MILIGHAGSVDEVAVGQAKFLRALGHVLGKGRFGTAEPFGQHDRGIVAGLDDHAAYEIFDPDLGVERSEHLRALGLPGMLADWKRILHLQPAGSTSISSGILPRVAEGASTTA